jgi:hypothetical protein
MWFALLIAFVTLVLRALQGRPTLDSFRRFTTWSVWLAVFWLLLLPCLSPIVAGTVGAVVLAANLMSTIGRWSAMRSKKTSVWDIWTHGGLLLLLLVYFSLMPFEVSVMWTVWGGLLMGVAWWIAACIPQTWPYPGYNHVQTHRWCAPVVMILWLLLVWVVAMILRACNSKPWPLLIEQSSL